MFSLPVGRKNLAAIRKSDSLLLAMGQPDAVWGY
jgi:hypothetical protein